jgi:hypothetical protein
MAFGEEYTNHEGYALYKFLQASHSLIPPHTSSKKFGTAQSVQLLDYWLGTED